MGELVVRRMMRNKADDADIQGLVISAAFGGPQGQQAYKEAVRSLRGG